MWWQCLPLRWIFDRFSDAVLLASMLIMEDVK